MLRKLIAFAITSGLAKKAWDHYQQGKVEGKRHLPVDITEVIARPVASADPAQRRGRQRVGARRRREGPAS
jgi:hypothetical protein